MKNLIKLLLLFVLGESLFSSSALSIYKQIGSVAALSEQCLQSKKISVKVQVTFKNAVIEEDKITTLVSAYNDGYKKALLSNKIWNDINATWSKEAFNCDKIGDVRAIEKIEKEILLTF